MPGYANCNTGSLQYAVHAVNQLLE